LNKKKELFWSFATLIIAAVSIWAVISQANHFSIEQFTDYISSTNPLWLFVAICMMVTFIICEGLAILTIIKAFGYARKFRQGIVYSSADIYFSAITPSATGGQPACAYFMLDDGIPAAVVTLCLILNLTLYTVSIMVVGGLALVIRPQVFMHFNAFSKTLIVIGYLLMAILVIGFVLLMKKEAILNKILSSVFYFLHKIHVLRRKEYWENKITKVTQDYKGFVLMLEDKKKMILKAFLLNLIQRVAQICVPAIVFLSMGRSFSQALSVWTTQAFVTIGSSCIPIPGAMGISDYLLLDGIGAMMGNDVAINLDLLSRSISFYGCVIVSILIVAISYFSKKTIERIKRGRAEE